MLILGREIKVPLDVITESAPDTLPLTTNYAFALQQRLVDAHEVARQHLGKAVKCQKTNYDKHVSSSHTVLGTVSGHPMFVERKARTPVDCPWEGPYLVVFVLSDVSYHIQKSQRAKVIHADHLKP